MIYYRVIMEEKDDPVWVCPTCEMENNFEDVIDVTNDPIEIECEICGLNCNDMEDEE